MKLSRKKAIALCIELWEWLAETGKEEKEDWPEWDKHKEYNIPIGSSTLYNCWFCEYDNQRRTRSFQETCNNCPYFKKYGKCYNLDGETTYYDKWESAKTLRTRKKYAKLFLEQIKSIDKHPKEKIKKERI